MLVITFHKSTPQTLDKKNIILTTYRETHTVFCQSVTQFFEVKHGLTTLKENFII